MTDTGDTDRTRSYHYSREKQRATTREKTSRHGFHFSASHSTASAVNFSFSVTSHHAAQHKETPMATSITETHGFTLSGAPTVIAQGSAGNITIRRGEAQDAARLVVTKKLRGPFGGTEEELRTLPVAISQEGDTIRVDARIREPRLAKAYTIDLDFVVPAAATLNVELAAGNLRVEGTSGPITAEVKAGNTDLREVAGTLRIVNNAGNVTARGAALHGGNHLEVNAGNLDVAGSFATSATLDAQVNAGNVTLRLPRTAAVKVDAAANVGSVTVHDWPIAVQRQIVRQSASGETMPGATSTATLRANTGNITITAE